MTEPIPFAALHRFLTELGFVPRSVAGSHTVYDHAATGCQLVYPEYRDTDVVLGRHLTATRRFLDEFGLVEASQFENRLRQQVLAG